MRSSTKLTAVWGALSSTSGPQGPYLKSVTAVFAQRLFMKFMTLSELLSTTTMPFVNVPALLAAAAAASCALAGMDGI